MRRILALMPGVGLILVLGLVLQWRKHVFIAGQVELLQSEDPGAAKAARNSLQRIGRSAVRPVCALLAHEDEQVRARAALALANIGHAAACGPLMQAAKRGDFAARIALTTRYRERA